MLSRSVIFFRRCQPQSSVQRISQQKRFLLTTRALSSYSSGNFEDKSSPGNQNPLATAVTLIGGSLLTYLIVEKLKDDSAKVYAKSVGPAAVDVRKAHSELRKDLPVYTLDEITKHNSPQTGIWVTYGIGVYDITSFVPKHPGSDKVMLAAGSAIDPFWHIYQQHNTAEVLTLLESFRIGNLKEDDVTSTKDQGNPWAAEPKRHPILKAATERPFNAEPPASVLVDSFLTPNEFFYVRNHLPVPEVDIKEYELEIDVELGKGKGKSKVLKLDDLKKYPKHTVTATIMCGGNRRGEMMDIKPIKGLPWGPSAVGNAEWTGVRLVDVLKAMGVESDETSHVQFEGLDTDPTSTPYGASIPLAKAMDPRGDVILAYEMNGQPLSRDHGYPVRVIVPGVVGSRNVKWLGRIVVSPKESDSHWQQNDYKSFSPSTDWDTVDFKKAPAIQNMPVTSAICSPANGDQVKADNGFITIKGYAWSGGGQEVIRVDISTDGGKTWQVADLNEVEKNTGRGRHWSWSLWTARIPAKPGQKLEVWAKAVDDNYNVQPETFKNIWNLRGVVGNAYSRIRVNVK
ncbi:sulfite oxidase, mitochondrial isoform X2 [Uranotaenia lowii]|uniref:sulfite oxidase, mitochondrial isoform X2 n=1 Tax=Uranotaenia lowii TaxID=190385 RepID=UPI00247A1207|nr:sulfite oxidase, mitochondrial isoform X2 [Uranotaenia lowii]